MGSISTKPLKYHSKHGTLASGYGSSPRSMQLPYCAFPLLGAHDRARRHASGRRQHVAIVCFSFIASSSPSRRVRSPRACPRRRTHTAKGARAFPAATRGACAPPRIAAGLQLVQLTGMAPGDRPLEQARLRLRVAPREACAASRRACTRARGTARRPARRAGARWRAPPRP